jgi:hypothetical protein
MAVHKKCKSKSVVSVVNVAVGLYNRQIGPLFFSTARQYEGLLYYTEMRNYSASVVDKLHYCICGNETTWAVVMGVNYRTLLRKCFGMFRRFDWSLYGTSNERSASILTVKHSKSSVQFFNYLTSRQGLYRCYHRCHKLACIVVTTAVINWLVSLLPPLS